MAFTTTTYEGESEPIHSSLGRTHLYSFIAALAVSVALVIVWWSTQTTPPAVAVQRHAIHVEATWRCTSGHTFTARGGVLSQACPTCSADSEMEIAYECPQHGTQKGLVRLKLDANHQERVTHVSFRPSVWQQVKKTIHWSRCGRPMTPASLNPFAK